GRLGGGAAVAARLVGQHPPSGVDHVDPGGTARRCLASARGELALADAVRLHQVEERLQPELESKLEERPGLVDPIGVLPEPDELEAGRRGLAEIALAADAGNEERTDAR